jgi:hypothetical protein
MTYRSDLDALAARQAALETEVADRQRELSQTRQMLDEARARAKLPVLDNIRVAAPCTADWNQMTGDERARLCGDCNLKVYNLSGMTRDEAETLLRDREGRLCVRYFQRADGTILLKDCTVGVKRRRRRRIFAAGVAATLAGAGGAAALLVHRAESKVEIMGDVALPEHEIMGKVAAEPPGDATMGQVAIDPPVEMKGELEAPRPIMGKPPAPKEHRAGRR